MWIAPSPRRSAARTVPGRKAALAAALLAFVAAGTAGAAGPDGVGGPGVSRTVHDTRGTAAVGAVFHGPVSSAGDHYCTAGVVDSPGGDLVVTAAHCLSGGTAQRYFVPGYHDGTAPYGVWRLTSVTLDPAWREQQDQDADVAFARVAPLRGRRLQDVVGGFALATGRPASGAVRLTGYPSSADAPLTCENRVTAFSATQWRIVCASYSGGTSGSPWVTPDGSVVGVIGGHEEGGDTPDVSYSAAFGGAVAAQYRRAVAAGRGAAGTVPRVNTPEG